MKPLRSYTPLSSYTTPELEAELQRRREEEARVASLSPQRRLAERLQRFKQDERWDQEVADEQEKGVDRWTCRAHWSAQCRATEIMKIVDPNDFLKALTIFYRGDLKGFEEL